MKHCNSCSNSPLTISVGARGSPLSRAQCAEVHAALVAFQPHIVFDTLFLETTGDKDQKTSLRNMPQNDFFTREIDRLQLDGAIRISIHSAKDLPSLLPRGLTLVALTQGLDSRDALVHRGLLPPNPKIATSSKRRLEHIQTLFPDAESHDIRGTIEQRISRLNQDVDGVVIAYAALIRLNLTHLPHIILDCPTAALQGRLAILARSDDEEMKELFSHLDSRPPKTFHASALIEIVPLCPPLQDLEPITHFIFTSKNGVRLFHEQYESQSTKTIIAVGGKTREALEEYGYSGIYTALEETSEGIVELLKTMDLKQSIFFWPHSKKSRDIIPSFLRERGIAWRESVLYDTVTRAMEPLPTLHDVDEIFFSSPSTIDAFVEHYGRIPEDKKVRCQGPVTARYLAKIRG